MSIIRCFLVVLLFLGVFSSADVQAQSAGVSKRAGTALIIGNSKYEKLPGLKNPKRDAFAVSDRLKALGFQVTEVFDADAITLQRAFTKFTSEQKDVALALVYYAGHGVQLFDNNFLLATDVDVTAAERRDELGVDLNKAIDQLRSSGALRVAFMIDACRDNPFGFDDTAELLKRLGGKKGPTTQTSGKGLAPVTSNTRGAALPASNSALTETLFFFAAQPGHVSFDGTGSNSFFVEGLLSALSDPKRTITNVFQETSSYVRAVTKGQQVPQLLTEWTKDPPLGMTEFQNVDYFAYFRENQGRNETDAEFEQRRALRIKAVSGYSVFRGTVNLKASISLGFSTNGYWLNEAEKKEAAKIGVPGYLKISADIDRDGRDELIWVFYYQVEPAIIVESQGVKDRIRCYSRFGADIEVALKDLDGDSKPEILIASQGDDFGWSKMCVVKYLGPGDVSARIRDPDRRTLDNEASQAFKVLIEETAGQSVTAGANGILQVCGGSGCANSWRYAFNSDHIEVEYPGGRRRMFVDMADYIRQQTAETVARTRTVNVDRWSMHPDRAPKSAVAGASLGGLNFQYSCQLLNQEMFSSFKITSTAENKNAAPHIKLALSQDLVEAATLIDRTECRLGFAKSDDHTYVYNFNENLGVKCLDYVLDGREWTLPLRTQAGGLLRLSLSAELKATIKSTRAICAGVRPQNVAGQAASPRGFGEHDIDRFVREVYLGDDVQDYISSADIYAERVEYFNHGSISKKNLEIDQARHYKRWPARLYKLLPGSMKIASASNGVWTVKFSFEYVVANKEKTAKGKGGVILEVKDMQGRLRITKVAELKR